MDDVNWSFLQGSRKDVFMGKPFSSGSDPLAVSDLICRSEERTPASSQEFPMDLSESNPLGDLWGNGDILGDLESSSDQIKVVKPKDEPVRAANVGCRQTEAGATEEVLGDEQITPSMVVEDEKTKIVRIALLPKNSPPLVTAVPLNVGQLVQTFMATSPVIKTEQPKPLKRLASAGSSVLPKGKQSNAGRKKMDWKNADKNSPAYIMHREKNNQSVKKSRDKTKAEIQQLALGYQCVVNQNAVLEDENFELKAENSALTKKCANLVEECAGLKTQLESANRERCPNPVQHFADQIISFDDY